MILAIINYKSILNCQFIITIIITHIKINNIIFGVLQLTPRCHSIYAALQLLFKCACFLYSLIRSYSRLRYLWMNFLFLVIIFILPCTLKCCSWEMYRNKPCFKLGKIPFYGNWRYYFKASNLIKGHRGGSSQNWGDLKITPSSKSKRSEKFPWTCRFLPKFYEGLLQDCKTSL